jgi:hypothetical protein
VDRVKPCREIPFRIPPGGWAGKVLETPPQVEFSSFWVGGWVGKVFNKKNFFFFTRSWDYIFFDVISS